MADIRVFKGQGRVLEIGSSLGYMLECFQRSGFVALGIEPSKDAVEYSQRRGLTVEEGYFDEFTFHEQSFDIVVANHVLEHVPDPNTFLTGIRKVLLDDGLICIALPNFASLEARIFQRRWRFLMPEEHLFQFTPHTLRRLLERHGFTILDVKTTTYLTELASLPAELKRASKSDWKRLVYYGIDFVPAVIQELVHCGTNLQIIAAKR